MLQPRDLDRLGVIYQWTILQAAYGAADHVDGARHAGPIVTTSGSWSEEKTQRLSSGPVADVSNLDYLPDVILRNLRNRDGKVDLLSPQPDATLYRQSFSDNVCCGTILKLHLYTGSLTFKSHLPTRSELLSGYGSYHLKCRIALAKILTECHENLYALGEMTLWDGAQDILFDRA